MKIPGFTAEASLNLMQSYRGSWSQTEKINDVYPALSCIYGRWCGPGCSGPGAPIDDVDACCKAHDECYSSRGYFDCVCDQELLACLQRKISWTRKGRWAAAIWGWFKGQPCIPHFGGSSGSSSGGSGGGGIGGGQRPPTKMN